MTKKKHPMQGRKQSPETIAKRIATIKKRRESGELPPLGTVRMHEKRKYTKRKTAAIVQRTPEQLERDVKEALWCIDQAVAKTRRKIASGELSLTEVTDEETFLYMAKRYLEGGLKP